MLERFLQYSLDNNRKIRVVMADTLKIKNITVIALSDTEASYLTASAKKPVTVSKAAFLSASYARGDKGELEGTEV